MIAAFDGFGVAFDNNSIGSAHAYVELRALAEQLMRGRRNGTISATVLVHEAFLRLTPYLASAGESNEQILAMAAKAMRSFLVDHARRRGAMKRGGGRQRIPLEDAHPVENAANPDVLGVDEALVRLAEIDARRAQIVELRFFGGLTVEETAGALAISPATVKREWTLAKGWLRREIGE